jgi:hypothetical protein
MNLVPGAFAFDAMSLPLGRQPDQPVKTECSHSYTADRLSAGRRKVEAHMHFGCGAHFAPEMRFLGSAKTVMLCTPVIPLANRHLCEISSVEDSTV